MKTGSELARLEEADAPIRSLMPEPGRAERLERAVSRAPNGPLRGLVVAVKDIFHMDGLPTTAGSTLPVDELAGPEAAAVSLLRSAGAVIGSRMGTVFPRQAWYLETSTDICVKNETVADIACRVAEVFYPA